MFNLTHTYAREAVAAGVAVERVLEMLEDCTQEEYDAEVAAAETLSTSERDANLAHLARHLKAREVRRSSTANLVREFASLKVALSHSHQFDGERRGNLHLVVDELRSRNVLD